MSEVRLTGQLVCESSEQAELVVQHLPMHMALTRAEPGCISFEVHRTNDALIWQVDERFESEAAFGAHQDRVAASEWGRATARIRRQYSIEGLSR
ncbi:putative quinol monooxygenase [Microbacterium cremeum]|uniref:putative quinol monooxygenase n=1 Tax=Microbacterium cremeum TaxID=2782169 RepID=UPI0018873B9A|nr:antibiotic biosynthesis monooxygenase [Microbacterium cremeum]